MKPKNIWFYLLMFGIITSLILSACASQEKATEEPTSAPDTVEPTAENETSSEKVDTSLTSEYSKAILADMETKVDTSVYKKEGPYVIAVAGRDPSNGFGNTFQISINAYGDELLEQGVLASPLLTTATNDANQQISDIENFIEQSPDAIVVAPMGRAALVAPIQRAVEAGIPVILCTDGIEGNDFTTRVDVNLYEAGYQAAEGLAEILGGKGNVVLFHGIAGVDAAETERAGALAALENYPDIKLLVEEYAQWNIATAKQKMEALMAANSQIDGVWAGGGEMALGSAFAFIDAGKPIPAFGLVNVPNGFLRVAEEHDLRFVGVPDPASMSKFCLQSAVDVLEGKPVNKFIHASTFMEGVDMYDNTNFSKWYVPELNDDFIPSPTVDLKYYIEGGFERK